MVNPDLPPPSTSTFVHILEEILELVGAIRDRARDRARGVPDAVPAMRGLRLNLDMSMRTFYLPLENSKATAASETEPSFRTSSSTRNLELWFGAEQPLEGL